MQEFILAKRDEIAELCRTHHVRSLFVFGSAVRDDFNPGTSDIDLLVTFAPEADPMYAKNYYSLRDNLEAVFRRDVDLVGEGVIRNRYRLQSIEEDKVEIYAA